MAAFTNSLGDMEVVEWREFCRMKSQTALYFLHVTLTSAKDRFSLFIPSPYLSSMRTREEGAKLSGWICIQASSRLPTRCRNRLAHYNF